MITENTTKEQFFERLGALSDDMIAAYGRDFTMGALIIAARCIAQGQPVENASSIQTDTH